MRVVLATLNAKFIHSSLALRYLRHYCREVCPEIIVKEYTINNERLHILGDIYQEHPDVLGFACYIWNIEAALVLVSLVKKVLPRTVIVLGGPEVSYDPVEVMRANPAVDYVIQGEGEETLAQLITALRDALPVGGIPGLTGRCGSLAADSGPRIVKQLDTLPFPYDDSEMPGLKDKIIYYESSRGCPFSCEYCLSGAAQGVRFLSLERVFHDLDFFIRHNVRQVKFVDRTFNARREHYWPILQYLAAAECRTNFHFEIAADLLDDEVLDFLRNAPCGRFQFEIGVQSTNEATLREISRNNNWPLIRKNVQALCLGGNSHIHLDLIAGLPYEDYWRFGKSFNDVYQLEPDMLQLGFLKLLKGSALRRRAGEHGYSYMDEAPYEVLGNRYLDYGEIRQLKMLEELLNQMYNSGRFQATLRWLVDKYHQDAFLFFHQLTNYWEERGLHLLAHSGKTLYQYLSDFCSVMNPEEKDVCQGFLKFDALNFEKGATRPEWLPWNGEAWAKERNSFWGDQVRVRKYLPDYEFTTWRELKKNYHIEVFAFNIPDYLERKADIRQVDTVVLFSFRENPTCYQVIAEIDFWPEGR